MKRIISIAPMCLTLVLIWLASSQPVQCTPADIEPLTNQYYLPRLMDIIQNAETSIKVIMYNMVWYEKYPDSPSNKLINFLCNAAKRKVDVTVILNRDKKSGITTNENQIAAIKLANSGVKVLYDSLEQTTHAKLVIVDNRYVIIGSFNWSYYSLEKNNEVAIVIDSKEIAEYFIKYFHNIAVRSSPVILNQ